MVGFDVTRRPIDLELLDKHERSARERIADAVIFGIVQESPGLTEAGINHVCRGLDADEVTASLERLLRLRLIATNALGYDVKRPT